MKFKEIMLHDKDTFRNFSKAGVSSILSPPGSDGVGKFFYLTPDWSLIEIRIRIDPLSTAW
jgi:hypothetical protein